MRVRDRRLPLLSVPLFLLMVLFLAACSGTEEATHEEAAPLGYGGGDAVGASDGDSYGYDDMSAAPLEPSSGRTASTSVRRDASGKASAEGAAVGRASGEGGMAFSAPLSIGIVSPESASSLASIGTTTSSGETPGFGGAVTLDLPRKHMMVGGTEDGTDAPPPTSGSDKTLSMDMIVATDEIAEKSPEPDVIEDVVEREEPMMDAGQLTAGEWSDLREWKFWNAVSASNDWKHLKEYWGFGAGQRISVRVDNGSEPIPDAEVTLLSKDGTLLWTARSDNHGRAELFTGLDAEKAAAPYDIVVTANGKESRLGSVDPSREQGLDESPLVVRIQTEPKAPKTIDVMFMIDATGSMGDEMSYIKGELVSVMSRVRDDLDDDYTLRLSTNVYRDHGDEYVVRSTPFDTDIDKAISFLKKQGAGGGGDIPEAVEDALEDAIEKHEWSEGAQSRFLFLVLDAPPHYDAPRAAKIRALTEKAAKKGIRIIPVASSGIDKETEFLLRFMGIHTGGTYVFLTDHSGIGNSHIEPTIGDYAVEYLDDLLVRLIVQYTERPANLDAINPRLPAIK